MASDPRDYKLDIAGVKPPEKGVARDRPYLSIHFACCGVYSRVYRNNDGTAYAGRCPRCGRTIKFPIGRGGTDQRFFIVE
ncbi:MAG TPA: hypothetical protein VGF52_01185 [Tepidisphaeraceae bacterium]|jgi:hypothetical protein